MFKLPHILVMVFTAIFIFFYSKYLKKQSQEYKHNFFKFFAIITPFFYPAEWIYVYVTTGTLDLSDELPLYICSMFWLLYPIGFFLKAGFWKRVLMSNTASLGMIGGFFGMVFNTYVTKYPIYTFIPIRSLSYHFVMLLVSITLWTSGYYKAKQGDEFLSFIPLLLMMPIAIVLHLLYGWDYLYTAGGPGTPFAIISNVTGIPIFFIGIYLLLWFSVRNIMYRKNHYTFKELFQKLKH